MATDSGRNVFFTDTQNNVVWKVTAATGNISIVAGNGTRGFSGDGEPATRAQLNIPNGIAVDSRGTCTSQISATASFVEWMRAPD